MGGKSKTKTESTNTQKTTLNPAYQQLSDNILTQVNQTPDPAVTTAANGVINGGIANLQSSVNGDYLDPTKNTVLSDYVKAQEAKYKQQLLGNINTIGDASQRSGAYGGTRQGVTEGVAQNAYAVDALNAANSVYYDNYKTERQNQIDAGTQLQTYLDAQEQNQYGNSTKMAQILAMLGGFNSTTTGNSSGTTTRSANPVEQAIDLTKMAAQLAAAGG